MTATQYIDHLLNDGFTANRWDMAAHRQVEKHLPSNQRVKVCFDADDQVFTVIRFDRHEVAWEATFTNLTPVAVVAATVTAALAV